MTSVLKSEEETDTDVVAEKLVTAVGGDMTAMTVDDTKKVKQIAKTVIEKNKVTSKISPNLAITSSLQRLSRRTPIAFR